MVYYLIGVNVVGFFLFLINTFLYSHTEEGNVDHLLTITALLGGSLGIILSIFIFDRKALKGNMMSRVFVISVFIIQLIIVFKIWGYGPSKFLSQTIEFLNKYNILITYFIIINVVTFILYGVDKYRAENGLWRIRIVTLLAFAFLGGSIGAILAMYLFRHKTNKDYFTVGIPLIMIAQGMLIYYFMSS